VVVGFDYVGDDVVLEKIKIRRNENVVFHHK